MTITLDVWVLIDEQGHVIDTDGAIAYSSQIEASAASLQDETPVPARLSVEVGQ